MYACNIKSHIIYSLQSLNLDFLVRGHYGPVLSTMVYLTVWWPWVCYQRGL